MVRWWTWHHHWLANWDVQDRHNHEADQEQETATEGNDARPRPAVPNQAEDDESKRDNRNRGSEPKAKGSECQHALVAERNVVPKGDIAAEEKSERRHHQQIPRYGYGRDHLTRLKISDREN
jgi:hypothetical protein